MLSRPLLFTAAALLLAWPLQGLAQNVPFTSSNLPIVQIDTEGAEIVDEPKIMARMRVIDNGPERRNAIGDPPTGYEGWIGIEIRGASSKIYPKKQFGVETRTEDGSNRNVSLLGLPAENDWILNGPYSDKSLMRNVLAYGLARRTDRYASRTRFCEVVLNGEYWGLYVLQERIKRDRNRVDIATLRPDETSGDDLTGGYIVKVDKVSDLEAPGWVSPFGRDANPDAEVKWVFHDPDAGEIVPEQAAYIEGVVTRFERVFQEPHAEDAETGYPSMIDLGSFVDFVILVEAFRNPDGYRSSTYLYKDKDSVDGRLVAGPAWDFNYTSGNANFLKGDQIVGLQADLADPTDLTPVPYWWPAMVHSQTFSDALEPRWAALRAGPLHLDSLDATIDAHAARLAEAQARNFERWPVLGEFVWPNHFVGPTYAAEVAYLKQYLRDRIEWLDGAFARLVAASPRSPRSEASLSVPWPNPAQASTRVRVAGPAGARVRLDLIDALGRTVRTVFEGRVASGGSGLRVPTHGLAPGAYLLVLRSEAGTSTRRLIVTYS